MNMSIILIIFVGLALIVISVFARKKDQNSINNPNFNPYVSKKPLTPTEIIFYRQLCEALPNYLVLAQVQLSSFIKVDYSKINSNESYKWQNPLAQQSVDYLICNKDFLIVAAVELDDITHNSQSAIKRDNKKSHNLEAANIPLIRWDARGMPSKEAIQFSINKYQQPNSSKRNSITDINLDTFPDIKTPEWVTEPQKQFFATNIKTASYLVTIKLGLLGILFAIFAFAANNIYKNMLQTSQIPLSNHIKNLQESITAQNQQRLMELEIKREADKNEAINLRRQEIQSKNESAQIQNELQSRLAKESEVKEAIWNRDFKNKVDCTNRNDEVACGNDHIRARRKFEAYWEANKSILLNKE